MSTPPAEPVTAEAVTLPADMLSTLLNGLEFARQQGAFNTVPLPQLHALTGVQLYAANLLQPPADPHA